MNLLDDQLGLHRTEIKTDQWSVSIGEIFSMYGREKLRINPAFQRFFRWSDFQKTLLVESVLLGFPIPPLFFAQNDEGVLEVVDGVQRLSTLLQLRGVLRTPSQDAADFKLAEPLVMSKGQYLEGLEGLAWDQGVADRAGLNVAGCLTDAQRSDIEFAKLNATIIQRSSSGQSKYDVFRRLNSYGEPLTPQETRAALIASSSSECLEWLGALARDEGTAELLSLSDRQLERQYDVELVLRFFYLAEKEELSQTELRGFARVLDDYGLEIADDYPSERSRKLGEVFQASMRLVNEQQEAGGFFRRFYPEDGIFKGPFLNTAFEALGSSIGFRLSRDLPLRDDLSEAAREFWSREELKGGFATGRSTESRLSEYVPIGREILAPTAQHKGAVH
jgi:hypothetical protein